eukprot:3144187-Pyramimonas_sp.AAC.1
MPARIRSFRGAPPWQGSGSPSRGPASPGPGSARCPSRCGDISSAGWQANRLGPSSGPSSRCTPRAVGPRGGRQDRSQDQASSASRARASPPTPAPASPPTAAQYAYPTQ